MLVQRVVLPASGRESWTVLGNDDAPVPSIERYLAYLSDIEKSPNTVKAYAHDLKDWFCFLAAGGLDWREVRLEDIGEFVAWLRLPPGSRSGQVAVLPSVVAHCSEATVNRKLSALSAFYQHAARHGVELGELLTSWQPSRGAASWKPFLHHISKSRPAAGRAVSLKVARKHPRVLTAAEAQAILDACGRLRDRLLFALLYDSGIRIGEALGLRHEDIAAADRQITIRARVNGNGARAKSGLTRVIPVSTSPDFPDRFGSLSHAREFMDQFKDRYNHQHHHSGIGLHTPANVHYGLAHAKAADRAEVLATARAAHPERFSTDYTPKVLDLPDAAWINKPAHDNEKEDQPVYETAA